MEKTQAEFEAALEAFRTTAEAVVRKHFARNGYTFAVPGVKIGGRGKRYVKLIDFEIREGSDEPREGSVHSFIEIETGNIFMPASYKAPAKHVRGNIFTETHGRESMSAAGHIHYLR